MKKHFFFVGLKLSLLLLLFTVFSFIPLEQHLGISLNQAALASPATSTIQKPGIYFFPEENITSCRDYQKNDWLKHIFCGTVNRGVSPTTVSGFHSRRLIGTQKIAPPPQQGCVFPSDAKPALAAYVEKINTHHIDPANDFYEAVVCIQTQSSPPLKYKQKPNSTMFPDNWKVEDVKKEVRQALEKWHNQQTDFQPTTEPFKWEEQSSKPNIRICGVAQRIKVNQTSVSYSLATVYPVLGNKKC
jgi:hypothetical protein